MTLKENIVNSKQLLLITACIVRKDRRKVYSLHQVVTFDAETNIPAMVNELQDAHVLAKISDVCDPIAREAK